MGSAAAALAGPPSGGLPLEWRYSRGSEHLCAPAAPPNRIGAVPRRHGHAVAPLDLSPQSDPRPPRPRCTRYAYGAGVAAQKQPYLNTLSSMHTDQHPVLGFVRSCKKLAAAQRKRDDDAASAAPGRKPIAGAAPGGGGAPNEN